MARQKANTGKSAGGKSGRSRGISLLLFALVLYSAWEFSTTGSISWPQRLFSESKESVGDYATRPEAGWRKAADAVNSLGEAREGQRPTDVDISGRVVRVADGDTISVLDRNNRQHKVRFFGIDAPERDQPHGAEAQEALRRLVDDQQVGVVIVETDDYGRTVGTVYRDDTNINHALVQGGHAWWYRYHAPHERHLEAAESAARRAGRGLWAADKPVAPWDWRRGRR